MARNFEVGKTVMTDKLQVHDFTHKVDLISNRHAKIFFAATALKFVAAHMSAQLNWEHLFLRQSLLNNVFWFCQAVTEDWKKHN